MADEPTRSYDSPLRERQAAATRRAILQAAAELILRDGLADFSMQAVADRAEVSAGTVYYHFPSRQAVLDGLHGWVTEQMEQRQLQIDPRDIVDVPGRIAAIFEAFDEIGAPARAMARLSAARGMRSEGYRDRTEAFRQRFGDVLDPLPDRVAEARFAVLRHLISSMTWMVLHDDFGLDGETASEAIAWAIDALLESLRNQS